MPKQLKLSWERGEKTALAERCNLSPSYLSDILSGRKRASHDAAARISREAEAMGLHISRLDVLYPHESRNPLISTIDG